MTLQYLKDVARAELRKLSSWAGTALLIALPWADEIKKTVADNLPALQPYLPENVYKFMGGAVVVAGMVLSIVASHRAIKASR